MDRVNVGLVGYGLAGRAFHAPLIRFTPGLTLKAIVSSDATKVRADMPDADVVSDLDTLLADRAIDLVVLATPDALHASQALAALEAGKHVLVDKPFAPTMAEARSMADRAASAGRVLGIFHNRRWDADFLTLRRLIHDGALGEVVQFESHFDRFRPDLAATWKDARPGGAWLDLGPHLVDQALALVGPPLGVQLDLACQRSGASTPDWFHATLRYERLRVILHSGALIPAHDLRFAVHGTRASFVKHGLDTQENQARAGGTPVDADWGVDPRPGTLTRADGSCEEVAGVRGDYPAFYAALRDAVLGHGPNPVPPEQALAVMEVLELGLDSASARREMSLPSPGSASKPRTG